MHHVTSQPPPYSTYDVISHLDNPGQCDETSAVYVKPGGGAGGGHADWTSAGDPPAHGDYARLNPPHLGLGEYLHTAQAQKLGTGEYIHPGAPGEHQQIAHAQPGRDSENLPRSASLPGRDSENLPRSASLQEPEQDQRASNVYMTIGDDAGASS